MGRIRWRQRRRRRRRLGPAGPVVRAVASPGVVPSPGRWSVRVTCRVPRLPAPRSRPAASGSGGVSGRHSGGVVQVALVELDPLALEHLLGDLLWLADRTVGIALDHRALGDLAPRRRSRSRPPNLRGPRSSWRRRRRPAPRTCCRSRRPRRVGVTISNRLCGSVSSTTWLKEFPSLLLADDDLRCGHVLRSSRARVNSKLVSLSMRVWLPSKNSIIASPSAPVRSDVPLTQGFTVAADLDRAARALDLDLPAQDVARSRTVSPSRNSRRRRARPRPEAGRTRRRRWPIARACAWPLRSRRTPFPPTSYEEILPCRQAASNPRGSYV